MMFFLSVLFTDNGYMTVLRNFDWKIIERDLKMTIHYLLMCDMDISHDCLFKASAELAIVCNLYYLEKLCKAYNIPFYTPSESFVLTNIQESDTNLDDMDGLQILITSLLNFVRNI